MLFFSMKNKVIVNLSTGEKLGYLKNCDLRVDEKDGKIRAILMPRSRMASLFSQEGDYVEIPWEKIRKIGIDTILVEI